MSVPSDSVASPAATAAALPPDEPPGTRCGSQGFPGGGRNADDLLDEPKANSSRLTLPTVTAPAASSRATGVALYGDTKLARMRDPAVDSVSRTQKMSFTASGTPARRPGSSPARHPAVDRFGLAAGPVDRPGDVGVDLRPVGGLRRERPG